MSQPAQQFPLQLSPEQRGFKEGENVSWCGVAGKVLRVRKSKIYVKFINHVIHTFLPDGRYLNWHNQPSLLSCTEEELKSQALAEYKRRHNE